MTDFCDVSIEGEQSMRDDALHQQAHRAGLAGKTLRDSARRCRVCAEPLPLARRRALPGVQTCVDCQHDLERAL